MIRPPQVFAVPAGEGLPAPSPYHFERVWNDAHDNKPGGGLWTSTYRAVWRSDWLRFASDVDVRGDAWRIFLLRPKANVRLRVIDNRADLEALLEEYPITECWCPHCQMGVSENMLQLDPRAARRLLFRAPVDYERMTVDGWDGVWLTEDGQNECREPDYGQAGEWRPDLFGWDTESTLWLRWAFDNVEYVGIVTAAQIQAEARERTLDAYSKLKQALEEAVASGTLTDSERVDALELLDRMID